MPKSIRRGWYDMRAALGAAAAEIFIYGEIGWEVTAKTFLEDLREVAMPTTPLVIHINCIGGNVFEGLAIYNVLKARTAPVEMRIDGIALSMGSVIAMAGNPVVMPESALMMIHDPRAGIDNATPEEMHHRADALAKVRDQLVGIYVGKSGQDEASIRRLLGEETWLTGTEAKALGLADEVIADEADLAAVAKFDFSNCRALPDQLRTLAASAAEPKPRSKSMEPKTTPVAADQTIPAAPLNPAPIAAATAEAIASARAEAQAAERTRVTEIGSACRAAKMDAAFTNALIVEGVSLGDARARIIDAFAAKDPTPEPRTQIRAAVTGDEVDRFRAGASAALLMRAGLGGERNEYTGYTLREIARASLDVRNINTKGMMPLDLIGNAFVPRAAGGYLGTSDFANLLSSVAGKAMLKGYEEAEETFQKWTATGILTDFKPSLRVDSGLFDSLAEIPEGAEYKYGTIGDRGETIQLATYGKMFAITRQTIINDDLGAFTRVPQKMGRAAIRTIGNLVYAVLTANAAMSDGKALFHADHKNLAGTAAAPSTASLDKMRTAMGTQRDPDSKAVALNISPAYVLVPKALEGTAKSVIAAEYDTASGDKMLPNSVRNIAEVVADGRLDIASTTAWYGAANPNQTDTVEVAYLDGNSQPYLETKDGWNVDGVEMKVRMDAGVNALDFRGLYKNAGA